MDITKVPYKVRTEVATFEGEWTAEEIDAGLAGESRVEVHEQWFKPSERGPLLVSDPEEIAELEARIEARTEAHNDGPHKQ
jgi:hypothetical protein